VARLEKLLADTAGAAQPTIVLGMGEAGQVRRCRLTVSKPELKAPGTSSKRLGLKYGQPPSKFAFNFSLRRSSQVSRLLAAKFGSFLTFGALRSGAESAPGQPTLAHLR